MTQKHNPDQAMAAMLKRKSAWPASASGECPDAGTLAAYFERSLTPAETSRWESHFSSCSRCQEQLAALVRSEFPTQAKPAETKTPAFAWLWNWRFLGPVGAAAVLLLAFVISQQMIRVPVGTKSGELMAKRDIAAPAPAPPEPQQPPAATADQNLEKGKAAADELREDKALAARAGARANLPAKQVPAEKSANVASDKYALAPPPQPADAGGRFAAAPVQAPAAQQAAPVTVVTAPAETAKSRQQAAQENRIQAAPPAAQQVVTVEGIQKQERDAKIAEAKALADRAAPVVDLKREAAGKKEGAATGQAASNRARSSEVGGVAGGVMGGVAPARMRAATGEFIVVTPDTKILWRFHPSGLIERSNDTGKSWAQQKSPTREVLLTGSAPSDKVCWAGGKNGVLLRTTDGGENWEIILSPTQSDIVLVRALDQLRVTITDSDGRSYETPNAGRLWRTP